MAHRKAGLAFAAALLTLACGSPHVRQTLEQQQREAEAEIERKLVELDQRIERLRIQVQSARNARTDAVRRLRELEAKGRELRQQLQEARHEGRRTLDETLGSIDRAMKELEKTLGLAETDEPEV